MNQDNKLLSTKEFSRAPWIEKYRPKTTADLLLNDTLLTKINKIIKDKDMPNLLITGIPGIGKTTTIKCIVRKLYGRYVNDAVLELNASDDRGIKAVQDIIINFCKKKLDINPEDKKLYASHKIIILDEADNMTPKAQVSISSLIEKYHTTTRFALTCNNSSDIIEGIQSRCNIMRYMRIDAEKIYKRLKHICEIEHVPHTDGAVMIIAELAQGDVRTAINNLQLVYNCYKDIVDDFVYNICDKPQPTIIKNMLDACINGDLKKAISIFVGLKKSGFVESDIVLNMIYIVRNGKTDWKENIKHVFMNHICNTSYIISKGFDSPIQVTSCLAKIISDIKKN